MTGVYLPVAVPVVAYFLPRGMSRAQYAALGLDVATRAPKTLRPDPKVVREAVLTAKKLGFDVTRIDTMSIDLCADEDLLAAHFGVTYVPGAEGPTDARLVDPRNSLTVYSSAEPLAASPLRDLVFIIAVVPRASTLASPFRPAGRPDPNEPDNKQEPWHVWPDELRQTLNGYDAGKGTPQTPQEKNRYLHGLGARISLVDTGIERTNRWITGELGIPANDPQQRLTFGDSGSDYVRSQRARFLGLAASARDMRGFITALQSNLRRSTVRAGRFRLSRGAPARIKTCKVGDITIGDLLSAGPRPNPYALKFYRYVQANRAPEVRLIQELANKITGYSPPGAVELDGSVTDILGMFKGFMDGAIRSFDAFIAWADTVLAGQLVDRDGHGTQMTVSMLSIAGAAQVRSFCSEYISRYPFAPYIDDASTAFCEGAFRKAVAEAEHSRPEQKIISNSWGAGTRTMVARPEHIPLHQAVVTGWRHVVHRACAHDIVVCFSVGNGFDPVQGKVNIQPLTGHAGAIIVGGAYKRPPPGAAPFKMGDGDVYLASAAHAYDHGKEGIFPEKGRVPDVCGLVGPLPPAAAERPDSPSPYVYLPSINGDWNFRGGGTSSACAQVAGICALIRARYPGFSASDVKTLIVDNGQAVEKGESYNRARQPSSSTVDLATNPAGLRIQATDFSPRLKLVSIRDVVRVAHAKARLRHFTIAGGRP